MGRNKIAIERIPNERNRQATFTKRKNGLLKKAMELSILCECEIALIIFSSNNKLFQYSSSDMEKILQRYAEFSDRDTKALKNTDYDNLFEGHRKKAKGGASSSGMDSSDENGDEDLGAVTTRSRAAAANSSVGLASSGGAPPATPGKRARSSQTAINSSLGLTNDPERYIMTPRTSQQYEQVNQQYGNAAAQAAAAGQAAAMNAAQQMHMMQQQQQQQQQQQLAQSIFGQGAQMPMFPSQGNATTAHKYMQQQQQQQSPGGTPQTSAAGGVASAAAAAAASAASFKRKMNLQVNIPTNRNSNVPIEQVVNNQQQQQQQQQAVGESLASVMDQKIAQLASGAGGNPFSNSTFAAMISSFSGNQPYLPPPSVQQQQQQLAPLKKEGERSDAASAFASAASAASGSAAGALPSPSSFMPELAFPTDLGTPTGASTPTGGSWNYFAQLMSPRASGMPPPAGMNPNNPNNSMSPRSGMPMSPGNFLPLPVSPRTFLNANIWQNGNPFSNSPDPAMTSSTVSISGNANTAALSSASASSNGKDEKS